MYSLGTMRRKTTSEALLRVAVRGILREAPQPDEPGVDPEEALGRYAFPQNRLDRGRDIDEPDTDLEERFFDALVRHYDSSNSQALQAVWPEVVELERRGLYQKLLRPPEAPVYRLMTLDADRAALFLGVDEAELQEEPGMARRAPSPPPFKPRGYLSSWTVDALKMVRDSGNAFVDDAPGTCSVLLVANTRAGEFLMNPQGFARGWSLGSNFASEGEVIGGGEIPLVTAAWMWHGESMFNVHDFDDAVEARISGVASDIKTYLRDPSMPEDKRTREEMAVWREFVEGIEEAAWSATPAGLEVEPGELEMVRAILKRPRLQAQDPGAFEELRRDTARGYDDDIVNNVPGRWLVTAAKYLKSEMMMTLREVDLGPRGPKSPALIVKSLLAAVRE